MIGQGLSTAARKTAREEFRNLGATLGLFQLDRWDFNVRIQPKPADLDLTTFAPTVTVEAALTDVLIEAKLAERIEAKRRKDFKQADVIREELKSRGVTIEDKPDGTSRWKR
jgi:cysteinyl-tRNA synthetase